MQLSTNVTSEALQVLTETKNVQARSVAATDEFMSTTRDLLACGRPLLKSSPQTPVECHHLLSPDEEIKGWNPIG